MGVAQQIVKPCDCAFVLTFPTTRADFYDDTARGSDFLERYFQTSSLTPEERWNLYKPVAELTEEVASSLRRYGVNVILRASFSDCLTALAQNKVTVLFAHWRSSEIYEADVHCETLSDTLAECEVPGAPSFLRGIIKEVSFPLSPEGRTVILTELNRAIHEDSLGDQPLNDGPFRLPPTREHKMFYNRKALDAYLPGCFRNGASVEFANGLTLIEAFAERVSPNFVGLFDLSVCNSILLGEMIKARARNCLVVGTELPAIVEFRLLLYQSLFGLLRPGRAYLETLTKLREELLRSLKKGEK